MGNLPSISPKDLLKILNKKGFQLDRIKGSHHILKNSDGARVIVPFHVKDLPKGTLFSIMRQAGLKKEDLT
jgi:predicted RNA binding protein YcfA (HicA-like mRNA interferase family)